MKMQLKKKNMFLVFFAVFDIVASFTVGVAIKLLLLSMP